MEVNLVGVLVAAIAAMAWGAFYYSPVAAGKAWMKEMGKSMKDLEAAKKEMPKLYAMNFVFTLVMTYVLADVLNMYGAVAAGDALQVAFWIWLGFIATLTAGAVLWADRTWKGWAIDNLYWIIALGVSSLILTQLF